MTPREAFTIIHKLAIDVGGPSPEPDTIIEALSTLDRLVSKDEAEAKARESDCPHMAISRALRKPACTCKTTVPCAVPGHS